MPATTTRTTIHRVLPAEPYESLDTYVAAGGGAGLRAARAVAADVVLAELEASGLRGRGGAGFPTAVKWRTVAQFASSLLTTSVVVNAAEGEPGTFKDRAIIRANPYAVLEGALIAARVIGSRHIVIATKQRFADEQARLRGAIAEVQAAGWCDGIDVSIAEGPSEYLFGEETALLEVLDGRPPFPRIAPPWRRGVVEVVRSEADVDSGSGSAAEARMATAGDGSIPPPVLVNNVETLANVPGIVALGAAWFRSVGTDQSPGTVVCTVTGAVEQPTVVEVALGTPLRSVIDEARGDSGDPSVRNMSVGGGDIESDRPAITAVLMGVSNAILLPSDLDTPISYEAMKGLGSGLGSAGFIVVDDRTHPLALAAGASRFLAIESCGQCTACKQDGLLVFEKLRSMCVDGGSEDDLDTIGDRLRTITEGARCNLAAQHQVVVGSILDAFGDEIRARVTAGGPALEPALVAELVTFDEGAVALDETFLAKRADWTYTTDVAVAGSSSPVDDPGRSPVDRFTDHRGAGPES